MVIINRGIFGTYVIVEQYLNNATRSVAVIPKVAAHNALADAHHQVLCLQWCYKQLGV